MKKPQLYAATLTVALTLVLNHLVPEAGKEIAYGEHVSRKIPFRIGDWVSSRDLVVSEEAKRVLGTDDILHRVYRIPGEPGEVLLSLVFSAGHRHSMHPPEVCYQSQGYKLIGRSSVVLPYDRRATVLRLAGPDGETLVNYWFFSEGRETPSYMTHQVHLILNQILFSTQPSVLLRLSTKIVNQDAKAAQEKLSAFASEAIPVLRENLPRSVSGETRPVREGGGAG